MTLNFETDNIFYVPEGGMLRIFDLYDWRIFSLDVHNFRLYLNTRYRGDIKKKANEAYRRAIAKKTYSSQKKQIRPKLKEFFNSLEVASAPAKQNLLLQRIFAPQQANFWMRLSDSPLESFFPDDYQRRQPTPRPLNVLPLYGSLIFSTLGDYELMLPQEDYDQAFLLDVPPSTGISVSRLPADQLLPIDNEFCGSFGYSNKGNLITYTKSSEISTENLCCIPLYRIHDTLYATLYLHLQTPVKYDVIIKLPERVLPTLHNLFAEHGFHRIHERNGNTIYRRQDDVLHLYKNVAGRESLGRRFLVPFILLVQKNGTHNPDERSKLIDELALRFR